jgi:hypothetical protein
MVRFRNPSCMLAAVGGLNSPTWYKIDWLSGGEASILSCMRTLVGCLNDLHRV